MCCLSRLGFVGGARRGRFGIRAIGCAWLVLRGLLGTRLAGLASLAPSAVSLPMSLSPKLDSSKIIYMLDSLPPSMILPRMLTQLLLILNLKYQISILAFNLILQN